MLCYIQLTLPHPRCCSSSIIIQDIKSAGTQLDAKVKDVLSVNIAVNSAANVLFTGEDGKPLHRPKIVGSATEGALLLMIHAWGLKFTQVRDANYNKVADKIFPFNSGKKRATAIIRRPDGSVRVLVKGATEWVLNDCTSYTLSDGTTAPLTEAVRKRIDDHVFSMADRGRSTMERKACLVRPL